MHCRSGVCAMCRTCAEVRVAEGVSNRDRGRMNRVGTKVRMDNREREKLRLSEVEDV
jgi:hypothetical protein